VLAILDISLTLIDPPKKKELILLSRFKAGFQVLTTTS